MGSLDPLKPNDVDSTADGRIAPSPEPESAVADEVLDGIVGLCRLLADQTRVRVLFHLTTHGELHVQALCELLGESQPAVSHHLGMLRAAGWVARRREGKHNYYSRRTQPVESLLGTLFQQMPPDGRCVRVGEYELKQSQH